ncbi:MAG: acyltransferase [Eubacteriales bacterium]|nr:acyltransferase [Eubacteriales bacterium]
MQRREWVSRYRDELKGIAILWVVLFHSQLTLPGAWDTLRQLGYSGVDIFFFLMGMGLYRSLQKNGELRAYASRRLWRVLPAYLPVLVAWMAVMYPTFGLSTTQVIRGVLGNLTMTGYWIQSPKVFNWFANGQFLFLLLAPLCYAGLSQSRKPATALVGLLALAMGAGLACIGQEQMMGASRLPVFLLGMAFGMEWPISKRRGLVVSVYFVAFAVGLTTLLLTMTRYRELLIDYGLYWYPFALMTPVLCVFFGYLFHKAEKATRLFAPLRLIGRASFEIYLLNIWMIELAKLFAVSGAGMWALLCAGNLLAGLGYHALIAWGTRALRTRRAA